MSGSRTCPLREARDYEHFLDSPSSEASSATSSCRKTGRVPAPTSLHLSWSRYSPDVWNRRLSIKMDQLKNTMAAIRAAAKLATSFFEGLPSRPVAARASREDLLKGLGGPLPDSPTDPEIVIKDLVRNADQGILGGSGGRFFGWVHGGSLPAALAADWLTSAWDQNAALYACGNAIDLPNPNTRSVCRQASFMSGSRKLLAPQRRDRIETCGASSRNVATYQCGRGHDQAGDQQTRHVGRVYSEELAGKKSCKEKRTGYT